jgi:2-polyprenyl-3-methyl-5-hydroxy-6-metoxy-1,4-benzoquinol methylase
LIKLTKELEMETKYLYNSLYYRKARKHQMNYDKLNKMMAIILSYKPKRVLDVGCGVGILVELLRQKGVAAYGTDFSDALLGYWKGSPYFQVADAAHQPFPNKSFDLVVSTDVLEHIPEEDLDAVKKEMLRVGDEVLCFPASEIGLNNRQKLFHVTNKPIEWWIKKFEGCDIYDSRLFDGSKPSNR